MKVGIIVLAAGASRRLGQPKQMLDIDGEPLLLRTVRAALDVEAHSLVVILGSNESEHRRMLAHHPVEIVYNEGWENGIGHSLKTGLKYLLSKNIFLDAIIILVCDQPLLTGKNIRRLIARYEQTNKPIVASFYSNKPGVPVLFHKTYFPELMALPDEEGAKKIILQNPADVSEVDFQGGETDLDTLDDYKRFTRNRPGSQ